MRILIAMDSFKECLTAPEAVEAVADALHDLEVDRCPVADGGEGTASVLGPRIDEVVVTGPRTGLRPVVGVHEMPGGGLVIDAAEVLGLALLPPDRRNPERATSRGLGEAIRQLAARGPLTIALGGSSTVDFGVGLAQGLGWRLRGGGGDVRVGDLEEVVEAVPPADVARAEVAALCDVRTKLRGSSNAIRLYGPQKGATPRQLDRLEVLLERWLRLLEDAGLACEPVMAMPGCGAAGGLGFGLALLAGARLIEGAGFVLDALGFTPRLARADLVITGEGRFDRTSLEGKITGAVVTRAREAGVPVVVVAGDVEDAALRAAGVAGVSLTELAGGAAAARAGARRWLAEGAKRAVGIAGWR